MTKSSNRFITIEGGEGAGKTTLIRFLSTLFSEKGYDCITTREPGGSFLGEEIREMLLRKRASEPVSSMAELFLFLAARAQHIHTLIAPALKEGKVVICDRFNDSTLAYQAGARGLSNKIVEPLCLTACQSIVPSLTLYLDVDPLVGMQRAKKRNVRKKDDNDRIESEDIAFHQRVREAFLALAKEDPKRIKTIDTMKPPAHVREQATLIVEEWLKNI